MEQILLSCPRPSGAVLHVRQEGDCNPTLESHLSPSHPCLLLKFIHTTAEKSNSMEKADLVVQFAF